MVLRARVVGSGGGSRRPHRGSLAPGARDATEDARPHRGPAGGHVDRADGAVGRGGLRGLPGQTAAPAWGRRSRWGRSAAEQPLDWRLRGLGEDDTRSLTLGGMAGAFGGLFSSPLLSMALVIEVARPARERFERTFFGSLVASSIAFAVYFPIVGSVFLGCSTDPGLRVRGLASPCRRRAGGARGGRGRRG